MAPYEMPKRIWAEGGQVRVAFDDGRIAALPAADALALGRLLNEAGGDALIEKILRSV